MNGLVLQPTSVAQWYALVKQAEQLCKEGLSEEIESYLVFMLMRFINYPELAQKIFAFDFLESLQGSQPESRIRLQDIGDECLLYAGLFPARAEKRLVHISYFVDIGRSAYATLALQGKESLMKLFEKLCENFVKLMDILQTMRDVSCEANSLTALQAEELWRETGSKRAESILRRYTRGAVLYGITRTAH